jgi:hypothetical protein
MEDIKAGKADWEDLVKEVLEEKAKDWEEHKDGFVTRHRTYMCLQLGIYNIGFYGHTMTVIFRDTQDNRELAQKLHQPHAAFRHCAKLSGFSWVYCMIP